MKAGLANKPFTLGLVTDHRESELISLLRTQTDKLKQFGVVSFEWREKASRGKAIIYNEELIVSADAP